MTVNNITTAISSEFRASATRFFLPGATEFASTLNLGEIIKGKVMRQYEGNRYLVDFGGHERVVDSVVPLTTGELIHGRVVALGERVELQRVYPASEGTSAGTSSGATATPAFSAFTRHERLVDEQLARYLAQMSEADRAVLVRATRMASDPGTMTLAGVMVSKLGLQQSPELLWPLYRAIVREDAASAGLYQTSAALELRVGATGAGPAAVPPLAEALAKQLEPHAARKDDRDTPGAAGAAHEAPSPLGWAAPKAVHNDLEEERRADARWLAHRLLNAQTGGAVAHRIGTIPLLLGDQLIEVDLAFFDQRGEKPAPAQTKHRKVVFALHTEQLGQVEITAHVAGSRVRLHVAADSSRATGEMTAHAADLRAALTAGGAWEVDEIVYETRQADSHNGVVRSVVEHVVGQDSLNRLV